MRLYYKCY